MQRRPALEMDATEHGTKASAGEQRHFFTPSPKAVVDAEDQRDDDAEGEEASEAEATFNPDSFLAQLQASSQAMDPRLKTEETQVDDDEIAALRGDIQRLQRYLREESRESQD